MMVISRTPFRMSFVGGGSDLSAYYHTRPGAVVSVTINKYMYVIIKPRFDDTIRVAYTKTEIVDNIEDIQHDLVREAMRLVDVHGGVEIVTVADVPAGTGMGSSSSLIVGLLNALYTLTGRSCTPEQLAEEACKIEIDILKRSIGKQDQYAAAMGGLRYIQFNPDETVISEEIECDIEAKNRLHEQLLLFYTGIRGDSTDILKEQRNETSNNEAKRAVLDKMVEMAKEVRVALQQYDITRLGELLHENWECKKQLTSGISSNLFDKVYASALESGALGGKILGAGGAGFMLLCSRFGKQEAVRKAVRSFGLRECAYRFEPEGSKIIYKETV